MEFLFIILKYRLLLTLLKTNGIYFLCKLLPKWQHNRTDNDREAFGSGGICENLLLLGLYIIGENMNRKTVNKKSRECHNQNRSQSPTPGGRHTRNTSLKRLHGSPMQHKHVVSSFVRQNLRVILQSKNISNDQELIQSDPISCPQNKKGNS